MSRLARLFALVILACAGCTPTAGTTSPASTLTSPPPSTRPSAADLYAVAGERSVRRLFDAFPLDPSVQDAAPGQWHDANLTDEALADGLGEAVHEQLGAFSLAF